MEQERVALSQKEIKRIKVLVYSRGYKPSTSTRGNYAACRRKRPPQHLRLTAADKQRASEERAVRIAYKQESKSLICVFELRGFIRGFTRAGRLLMGLCRRQIIRLGKKYTAQGEMGLIHGNRDRHLLHRIGEWIRHDVLRAQEEGHYTGPKFDSREKTGEGSNVLYLVRRSNLDFGVSVWHNYLRTSQVIAYRRAT